MNRSRWDKRSGRRGISLLEVMLATTIMMGSVMALSRLAFLARRHAIGSEDRTQSQLICQNLMSELLAGIKPLESVSPTETDDEEWIYSIDVEPSSESSLVSISITVARLEEDDEMLPADEELVGFRLVRWMRLGEGQSIQGDLLDGSASGTSSFDWNDSPSPAFGTAEGAELVP